MRVACGAFLLSVFVLGCATPEGDGTRTGEASTTAMAGKNCKVNIAGPLDSLQFDKVLEAAGSMTPDGSWVPDSGRKIAIQPLCESSRKDPAALRKGAFVARIMIFGEQTSLSDRTMDVVYWWVVKRDTLVVSQFVSTTEPDSAKAIKTLQFIDCDDKAAATKDTTGWHGDSCHSMGGGGKPGPLNGEGDNPWFGCTRGCCYAVGGGGPVPTDSIPRPRDTIPRPTAP